MTGARVRQREASRRQADDQLHKAIAALGRPTACHGLADEFTAEDQSPHDATHLVELCRRCPVLLECRDVAVLTPGPARAGSVMAGVRYDGAGRAVDLAAELAAAQRDVDLAALACGDSAGIADRSQVGEAA